MHPKKPMILRKVAETLGLAARGGGTSLEYWEGRYAKGGNSGEGSYGCLAQFKAEVLNAFVVEQSINTVLEFGCGDGNQLELARYPAYVGLDVSPTAVRMCQQRFQGDVSKQFFLLDPQAFADTCGALRADLVLSLDVIYHLLEDTLFQLYMERLISAAERFVIIYSSNFDEPGGKCFHVRHRQFSDWITSHKPAWRLLREVPNRYPEDSPSNFYIYGRA